MRITKKEKIAIKMLLKLSVSNGTAKRKKKVVIVSPKRTRTGKLY